MLLCSLLSGVCGVGRRRQLLSCPDHAPSICSPHVRSRTSYQLVAEDAPLLPLATTPPPVTMRAVVWPAGTNCMLLKTAGPQR